MPASSDLLVIGAGSAGLMCALGLAGLLHCGADGATQPGSAQHDPDGVRVQVGHLTDEVDAARMAEIVATAARLVDDLAGSGLLRVPADAWWRSDDLVAARRRAVGTYNHHSGTCRMGASADPGAVVDPLLNAIGVEGSRSPTRRSCR
jgi:choline dehydrogenase-like flavoprotein